MLSKTNIKDKGKTKQVARREMCSYIMLSVVIQSNNKCRLIYVCCVMHVLLVYVCKVLYISHPFCKQTPDSPIICQSALLVTHQPPLHQSKDYLCQEILRCRVFSCILPTPKFCIVLKSIHVSALWSERRHPDTISDISTVFASIAFYTGLIISDSSETSGTSRS